MCVCVSGTGDVTWKNSLFTLSDRSADDVGRLTTICIALQYSWLRSRTYILCWSALCCRNWNQVCNVYIRRGLDVRRRTATDLSRTIAGQEDGNCAEVGAVFTTVLI